MLLRCAALHCGAVSSNGRNVAFNFIIIVFISFQIVNGSQYKCGRFTKTHRRSLWHMCDTMKKNKCQKFDTSSAWIEAHCFFQLTHLKSCIQFKWPEWKSNNNTTLKWARFSSTLSNLNETNGWIVKAKRLLSLDIDYIFLSICPFHSRVSYFILCLAMTRNQMNKAKHQIGGFMSFYPSKCVRLCAHIKRILRMRWWR